MVCRVGVLARRRVGSRTAVSFTIPDMPRPRLLGHRGARATRSVLENTIASFDLTLAHGCDGFEFDVRHTPDGRAVICHDPTIHGVEIARATPGDLADLPVLEQVLERYQASAFLDIELKVPGFEATVLSALRKHPPRRGYVISSFLPDVLLALRKLAPELPLGLIAETSSQLSAWPALPAEFVMPHYTLMDINLTEALRAAGKKIFVWTVNGREQMLHYLESGVDGIISDETEVLGKLQRQP